MTQDDFAKEFQALVKKSGLSSCEITDQCLMDIGRLNVEEFGSFELGVEHLNGHLQLMSQKLMYETWRKTLH